MERCAHATRTRTALALMAHSIERLIVATNASTAVVCVAQVTSLLHTPHAQNMTLHVSDLAIAKVATMTFDVFSVTLSYKATWSDRYAVHPCAINLYDTGRGVVRRFARSAKLLIQPSPPLISASRSSKQIFLSQSAILTRSCLRSNDAPVEYAGRRGRLRAAGGVVDAAPVRSRRHQREREPFGRDSRDA